MRRGSVTVSGVLGGLALALGVQLGHVAAQPSQVTAIRGARIITFDQGTIERGTIVVDGSTITAIGSEASVPPGATVIDATGLTAIPGIIDAEGIANTYQALTRAGRSDDIGPMRAQLVAGDFFDPYGDDYRQERTLRDLVEWGVTAMNVKLTDQYVFDGMSSLVKVHAPPNYQKHFVKYQSALRINLGESARNDDNKFPTTRMGIVGLVRQEFLKAQAYQEKWGRVPDGAGESAEPPARDLKLDALVSALKGEVPVVMHAVEPMDIETALRIADEFKLRLVLSASTEALEAQAPELARRNVPVILGTYYASINSHTGEQTEFDYETAGMLARHGVKVAFGGLTGETKLLSVNAGIAVQHGMAYQEALKALTLHPAQIFGVDNRLGSLAPGKDADIVLYRGDPLEITSPVEKVLIGGHLVFERQRFDPSYHNLKR